MRPVASQHARRAVALAVATLALAGCQISSDPYTNASSQHATEVEPDTFANGSTLVATFQAGRFFDGGSTNIGWARSTDGGNSWSNGFLSGITTFAGGTYDRVSDPSVAYDANHKVWLISSLALTGSPPAGAAVLVSRSTDGGATWRNPVTVAAAGAGNAGTNLDKNWITCDDTATSPHFGHCYTEWDDNGAGNRVKMSTSGDGGLTWSSAQETANHADGLGGQPVVRPNGTVVVPLTSANETAIQAFTSNDGGASWGNSKIVSAIVDHTEGGSLRSGPLPSAAIDSAGKVYVAWQDCRFRSGCAANDIVMSTSTDGTSWSSVTRVPIDAVTSSVDHFIPGLAVDGGTSGAGAHLALAYYYYPNTSCTTSTCQLDVGFVSSTDGGQTWTSPAQLAGPLTITWLANTNQGYMVGDYISTSVVNSRADPVYASASAPHGSTLAEAMYETTETISAGRRTLTRAAPAPVLSSKSDHTASKVPPTVR